MKSVMLSIKPYWLFLIIAKTMGWKTDKQKTVEVRKSYPKDKDWDKTVILYCTKDKASFNQIPKEYQPAMAKFLGKVISKFVCDLVSGLKANNQIQAYYNGTKETCLSPIEIVLYANGKMIYYWHISDLKIYDKPKELSEFMRKPCDFAASCGACVHSRWSEDDYLKFVGCSFELKRPPQSWCYVEGLK